MMHREDPRPAPFGELPVAWKCENCHRWIPVSIGSFVVLVEDVADRWAYSGAIKKKGRFLRRMVVDPACRRKIMDVPGEEREDG